MCQATGLRVFFVGIGQRHLRKQCRGCLIVTEKTEVAIADRRHRHPTRRCGRHGRQMRTALRIGPACTRPHDDAAITGINIVDDNRTDSRAAIAAIFERIKGRRIESVVSVGQAAYCAVLGVVNVIARALFIDIAVVRYVQLADQLAVPVKHGALQEHVTIAGRGCSGFGIGEVVVQTILIERGVNCDRFARLTGANIDQKCLVCDRAFKRIVIAANTEVIAVNRLHIIAGDSRTARFLGVATDRAQVSNHSLFSGVNVVANQRVVILICDRVFLDIEKMFVASRVPEHFLQIRRRDVELADVLVCFAVVQVVGSPFRASMVEHQIVLVLTPRLHCVVHRLDNASGPGL